MSFLIRNNKIFRIFGNRERPYNVNSKTDRIAYFNFWEGQSFKNQIQFENAHHEMSIESVLLKDERRRGGVIKQKATKQRKKNFKKVKSEIDEAIVMGKFQTIRQKRRFQNVSKTINDFTIASVPTKLRGFITKFEIGLNNNMTPNYDNLPKNEFDFEGKYDVRKRRSNLIEEFIEIYYTSIYSKLKKLLLTDNAQLLSISLFATMGKTEDVVNDENGEFIFTLPNRQIITNSADIKSLLSNLPSLLIHTIDSRPMEGSGFRLTGIIKLEINCTKYDPLTRVGGEHIELPKWLSSKKCCINIKNDDDQCFKWCILLALHIDEIPNHPEKLSQIKRYASQEEIDLLNSMNYPVKYDSHDIERIEDALNISIVILGISEERDSRFFLRTIHKKYDNAIFLIFYKNHYVFVKSISGLINSNCERERWVCSYCLQTFDTLYKQSIEDHQRICTSCGYKCETSLPSMKDGIIPHLRFNNTKTCYFRNIVVYADCETMNIAPLVAKHWGGLVVYRNNTHPSKYISASNVDDFITALISVSNEMYRMNDINIPYDYYKGLLVRDSSESCYLCGDPKNNDFDIDHDHLTGEILGLACHRCNSKRSSRGVRLPVVFHNLKGFDGKFIIPALTKRTEKVDVIAQSREKMMTITGLGLQFIDSFQHVSTSLDRWASTLSGDEMTIAKEVFSPEEVKFVRKKLIFPYDKYIDDEYLNTKCSDIKIDDFFSSLKGCGVTQEDYQNFQAMTSHLAIPTLREYIEFYLKVDCVLLSECFERYRNMGQREFGFDPVSFITAPSLSWAGWLKTNPNEQKIELLYKSDDEERSNYNRNLMDLVQKNIRGGICMQTQRYTCANNRSCPDFNPQKERSHILYFDMNSLYSTAMTFPLPVGDFRSEDHLHFSQTCLSEIMNLTIDSPRGYLFECDFTIPISLHDNFDDYPPLPENYSPTGKKEDVRLIPHLGGRKNYLIHYLHLQLVLKLGVTLTKIHSVHSFKQERCMKTFIMNNITKRKNAKSEWEKNFYKLLNNSIYGKTIENVLKRQKVILCSTKRHFMKYNNSENLYCDRYDYIEPKTEDDAMLYGFKMRKKRAVLDKPTIIGFSILEISKFLMYNFHYNVMKPSFSNIKVVYTDTDSLVYNIKGVEDPYTIIKPMSNKYFDLSSLPKTHQYYSEMNKGDLGMMKDETHGDTILEWISIRPKVYSYITSKGKPSMKIKGVPLKPGALLHEDYRRCILGVNKDISFTNFKSKNFMITSERVTKKALVLEDIKRDMIDNVFSRSWGYIESNLNDRLRKIRKTQ